MSEFSNIIAVAKLKCPKCHEGDLFINKNNYRYKGFFNMPDRCPKCHQDFQIETGFYYGAMYSSYAITVAINAGIFLLLNLFFEYNIGLFLIVDAIVLLVTMPYVFKVSRAVWLALMVKYDSNAIKKHESKA
ncbi:MAG: DUF983 domain-containing protein [Flavobacteriales bacterium CG_4_10_14_0_2_um_filter_32_8]|nr:MAG: DUF983 domain-containing protein [Flavobacteriales bacterium CG_4_10_14_0_2_um_filter_32_8]PJB16309.1 MAG: DUF983 domain-containing protein [Flavobacteriales bacterium CG_4_9_14_3_um_filter_32_8]